MTRDEKTSVSMTLSIKGCCILPLRASQNSQTVTLIRWARHLAHPVWMMLIINVLPPQTARRKTYG